MISRFVSRSSLALAFFSAAWALGLSLGGPAYADEAAIKEIRQLILESSGSGGDNSSAFTRFSGLFLEIDRDGNGMSLQDVELVEKVRTAQTRAQTAVEKLRYDLDGDLVVTRQELESVLAYESGRRMRRLSDAAVAANLKREVASRADRIMKADTDGNGQLSGKEVTEPDPERNRDYNRFNQQTSLARAMLKADPNGDGILTEAETFAVLGQVFSGLESSSP